MCGIVGIYHEQAARPVARAQLDRMNESQHHRGPDEGGLYLGPGIGLGHRRLSIVDLSNGQQPLTNEDGTVVVTYNGEIYNFPQLMAELAARGHLFRSRCDTEVIVHAWEEWGEACVERFRGMFAFALWDMKAATLFLARDRLGIKPLYYADLPDGSLLFASELKALRLHPALPSRLDPCAVEDYFAYGYVPDPRTILAGVRKLAPGHCLTIRRGRQHTQPRSYWTLNFPEPGPTLDENAAAGELVERLREAVRIRLVADVPLGSFLSGGVDSSAVVAMMAGESTSAVETCSIAFDDAAYNEATFARSVAGRYGTSHRERVVSADSFDLVESLAGMFDEPFADSSAMPTFRVCQLARERVVVALSGDGGDEAFAGYRRYRWHGYEEAVRRIVPAPLRTPLFGLLGYAYPKMDWAPKVLRAKSTFQALHRDSVAGYFHSVSVLPDSLRQRLYSKSLRRDLQGYHAAEVLRRHMDEAPTDDPLSRVQYADLKTYLPGDILTKVDRTSMAVALEVRVPMLDHLFLEWVCGLPSRVKLKGREGKWILKKALEPHLPHDVLYRPKMGFSVPLSEWFRGPQRQRIREAATSPVLAGSGLFDMPFLKTMVDQHQAGLSDHGAALWSVLMFESFLRTNVGAMGDSPSPLDPAPLLPPAPLRHPREGGGPCWDKRSAGTP